MDRPVGVLVLGIIILILASFSLLGVVIGTLIFVILPTTAKTALLQAPPLWYFVFSLVYSAIIGVLDIVFAVNLLRLKEWARKGLVYLCGAVIVLGLASIFVQIYFGPKTAWIGILAWLCSAGFFGYIIYYLTRAQTKATFN